VQYFGPEGYAWLKFREKVPPQGICAIMRGLGFKNRNFGGFPPGKEVSKTVCFDCGGQDYPIISVHQ
jgi:hypothetical protein